MIITKKRILPILLILLLFLIINFVTSTDCVVKSSCAVGTETEILSMSSVENAHAGIAGNYPNYRVCCNGSITTTCNGTNAVLNISGTSNAHAQMSSIGTYPVGICMSNYTISYQPGNCQAGQDCLIKMSSWDNAHVSNCSASSTYTNSVCLNKQVAGGCTLTGAKFQSGNCSAQGCVQGDNVTMYAYVIGNCAGITTSLDIYGENNSGSPCHVRTDSGYDLYGVNSMLIPDPIPIGVTQANGSWYVPAMVDNCSGKTIYPTTANLHIGMITYTTNNVFGNITFKEIRTFMKCGNVSIGGVKNFNASCNVPLSPPGKICTYSDNCVYANEGDGSNTLCFNPTDTIQNAMGRNITCSAYNTWCPPNFIFNGTYCVPNFGVCDKGYSPPISNPAPLTNLTCGNFTSYWSYALCFNDFNVSNGIESPPYNKSCCKIANWDSYYFNQEKSITIY